MYNKGILIIFVIFIGFESSAQITKGQNNIESLLSEFYSVIRTNDNNKKLALTKSIDSVLAISNNLDNESLAIYYNSKGLIYYANELNPIPYSRKADSLNNLLNQPLIGIKIYSNYVIGGYYYDKEEDIKAREAYLKIIEEDSAPEEFNVYKSEAFDKIFYMERVFVMNKLIDSSILINTSKKLIKFKKSIKDTLNIPYGRALNYLGKESEAEVVFLAINNIPEHDARFNKYRKFEALNELNLYYYIQLNYNIEDIVNAKKLIQISEELLAISKGTNYLREHNIYSIYADIVIGSLITKDTMRIELYEGKILDVLNNTDYPNKVQLNLNRFYYTLHKLKMYFEFNKNYDKAKFYAFKNAELTKHLYGEISVEHERELKSYESIIQLKMFNYDEAFKITIIRERIIKVLFGEESEEYLKILYDQSNIRLNQYEHKKNLKLLEKAIEIINKINCQNSKLREDIWLSYLSCLNSNELYSESLEQEKSLVSVENYASIFRLSKIRRTSYSGLKNYISINNEFEWLLDKLENYSEILLADKSITSYYFEFLVDYQNYLQKTGRLNKALSFTKKNLYLFIDSENYERIEFMLNYLNILILSNKCDEALKFVEENAILKFSDITTPSSKAFNEYSLDLTLGLLYDCLEEYSKAIDVYERAIKYNGLDPRHLYTRLVSLYNLTGNKEKASYYLNEYESKIKNIDSFRITELVLIVSLFIENNEREKVLKYLLPLSDKVIDEICSKSFYSSNDNKNDKVSHDDVLRYILAYNYGDKYNSELTKNAVIISNLYKKKLNYYAQINQGIQKLKTSKNQDALNLEKLEIEFNQNPVDLLQEEISQVKTKLIHSNLIDFKDLCDVNFTDIYNSINENEVVINLLSYKYNLEQEDNFAVNFNFKNSSLMSTLVNLDNHISFDNFDKIELNFFDFVNDEIFQDEKINGDMIDTFYIIPSGESNLINFSAFSLALEEKLGKRIRVHIINSLTDITKIKSEQQEKVDRLILVGDIDFDKVLDAPTKTDDNKLRGIQLTNDIRSSGIPPWSYLPGTVFEIEEIEKLGLKNNIEVSILREDQVTEINLENMIMDSSKKNVIHFATHGYFFPDNINIDSDNYYVTHKNPLLRSGLILSGANNNWNNSGHVNSNNDGVLTAEEISFMDLSGVELIVLSACDTGLGDVSNLEGINGLQRAFKLAGVNKLIMSLWKVPDKETAEFFSYFYEFLLENMLSVNLAFRETQKIMKEKYKAYYWASFVLLE